MRSALVSISLSLYLLSVGPRAQSQSTTAACGSEQTNFDVKLDDAQHTLSPPEAGKARVYLVQDLGWMSCLGSCLTTKLAIDGAWIGVTKNNSYVTVSVDPGEHHLCASPQMTPLLDKSKHASIVFALAHFTAEADKVYYFRVRPVESQMQRTFSLDPIDSDEGAYLVENYPLSISHPKPPKVLQ